MKILLASEIDADAVARLREDNDVAEAIGAPEDELAAAVVDRDAIVFRSGVTLSTSVLGRAPNLRLLVRAGSGLDNLDLDYIQSRGIVLQRVPGPGAQAVAELTFGLMLCLARGILVGDHALREGRWLKHDLVGQNLRGKTLGIVGLGSIGSRVAALGTAWGMSLIGCVLQPSATRAESFARNGIRLMDLPAVLEEADFVTIHVPLNAQTRGLIGAQELARMKRGSYLVNVARGGVVDETALAEALRRGERPQGAALDVHEAEGDGRVSPLAGLPNVVLTPHIGAMTIDAQREIGREVVRIIEGAHEQG